MLLESVQTFAGLLRDREWHKSEDMGIVMLSSCLCFRTMLALRAAGRFIHAHTQFILH